MYGKRRKGQKEPKRATMTLLTSSPSAHTRTHLHDDTDKAVDGSCYRGPTGLELEATVVEEARALSPILTTGQSEG